MFALCADSITWYRSLRVFTIKHDRIIFGKEVSRAFGHHYYKKLYKTCVSSTLTNDSFTRVGFFGRNRAKSNKSPFPVW